MNRRHQKIRHLVMLLVGICCWMSAPAWTDPAPLTRADIETTLAVREKADALRLEALQHASGDKPAEGEPFAEMMAKIQRIGHEADQQACAEHGVAVESYRLNLRRLIAVGELVFFEEIRTGLESELRQRQAKTEANLIREADQTWVSTEQWYGEIQGPVPADTGEDQEKPELPEGYSNSLEQIVVEPIRQQAADGTLVETVRLANERRITEIHQQLSGIDRELSAPSMHQAILDKPAALSLFDPVTLQGLSSSLVEDIPLAAFEE